METKTVKITTCMRGFKRWIDAHPRKNLSGFFSINGRAMTDAEVRRVVSYAVENGYETEACRSIANDIEYIIKEQLHNKYQIKIEITPL